MAITLKFLIANCNLGSPMPTKITKFPGLDLTLVIVTVNVIVGVFVVVVFVAVVIVVVVILYLFHRCRGLMRQFWLLQS